MSRQDLKSLLDEMLTDATTQQQKEVREARPVHPADRDTAPAPAPPSPSGFTDVEQFRLVHDAELRKVLAAAARDDVLTMLSGASDGLRRKILTNLSRESVQWLQQNLEYFDEPTRALLAAGRKGVLDVTNKLLREGKIALPAPEPKDEAGAPKQPRMDDDLERLGSIFTELLGLAQKKGLAAVADVALEGGVPLLDAGLALLARGLDERALAEALEVKRDLILERYTRRLEVVKEGIMALARGEDPDEFRRRFDKIGQ